MLIDLGRSMGIPRARSHCKTKTNQHAARKHQKKNYQAATYHELRQGTEGTGDTKDDSVVLELLEAVGVQSGTRGSVDVREGVLGLAVFC